MRRRKSIKGAEVYFSAALSILLALTASEKSCSDTPDSNIVGRIVALNASKASFENSSKIIYVLA